MLERVGAGWIVYYCTPRTVLAVMAECVHCTVQTDRTQSMSSLVSPGTSNTKVSTPQQKLNVNDCKMNISQIAQNKTCNMQKQLNLKFQVSEGFLLELGLCCTAIGQNKDSLKLQNFQFQENKFFLSQMR